MLFKSSFNDDLLLVETNADNYTKRITGEKNKKQRKT